jgi:hypothetical protein
MSAIRFQTSSAVSERAVSETAKRVHAQAVDLLTRRAEINRRIRCLQQVMQVLRDLATNATFNGYGAEGPAPARTTERKRPGNASEPPPGHTVGQMWSPLPGQSKHQQAGLTRACRIALMEAATPRPRMKFARALFAGDPFHSPIPNLQPQRLFEL